MIVSSGPLAGGPGTQIALIGGGFIVIALIAVTAAAAIAVSRSRFRRRATRTSGTIVAHEPAVSRSSEGGIMYYSVVEFAMPGGEVIRARTRTASNPAAGRVGSTATVFYDPRDPYRVALDTGRTAVMNGCAIAVVAVLAGGSLLVGLILLQIGLGS